MHTASNFDFRLVLNISPTIDIPGDHWDIPPKSGWLNCAMLAGVGESRVGSARGSPTVEHHPVGDSVTTVARVVRAVEATPDFCGELSLLIGITGRKVSPGWRGDGRLRAG